MAEYNTQKRGILDKCKRNNSRIQEENKYRSDTIRKVGYSRRKRLYVVATTSLKCNGHEPNLKHTLAILMILPRHALLLMIHLR